MLKLLLQAITNNLNVQSQVNRKYITCNVCPGLEADTGGNLQEKYALFDQSVVSHVREAGGRELLRHTHHYPFSGKHP